MAADKLAEKSLVHLRKLAAKTLAQVLNSKISLEQAMTLELTRGQSKTFADFDRAWIYEVCSGVLRYKGRIDFIIDTYALKKKPTGALRRFLMISTYQLLVQEVPSALVVSESVEAVKASEGIAPSQFANAILRKVAENRASWQKWEVSEKTPLEEILAWSSLPEWIFYPLRRERGLEWTLDYAKACLARPQTWYYLWDEKKCVSLEGAYQGNEAKGYVQDISNQALVEKVAAWIKENLGTSPHILDLCSAPGGKSLGLAGHGYQVVATDIDEQRLQKVIENRSRLGLGDQIKIVPFKELWISAEKFDVIWIDAPCSSSGIIRRHPEVKWNRTEEELKPLLAKQKELVEWGRAHLTPQGILIYSTCSVLKAENESEILKADRIEHLEYFPQNEPYGDAIVASLIQSPHH